MADKKIIVTQTRSTIRRQPKQLATLKCLGLGRIGRSKQHVLSPALIGMLKQVEHLIVVHEVTE